MRQGKVGNKVHGPAHKLWEGIIKGLGSPGVFWVESLIYWQVEQLKTQELVVKHIAGN